MATERIIGSTTRTTHRVVSGVGRVPSRAKAGRRWRVICIIAACLVVWHLLAWGGAQLLIVKAELASPDAIVVLSGSSTYVERTDWAARLYRQGRAPLVILTNDSVISGWNEAEQRNPYFYELAAKELRQRGVPAERIHFIADIASSTHEESVELREYATTHHLKRLLVVTSAYHSRRALWSLRRVFGGTEIEVGIDSPPPGWQTPSPSTWWLHGQGWKVVAAEYPKMAYYRVKY